MMRQLSSPMMVDDVHRMKRSLWCSHFEESSIICYQHSVAFHDHKSVWKQKNKSWSDLNSNVRGQGTSTKPCFAICIWFLCYFMRWSSIVGSRYQVKSRVRSMNEDCHRCAVWSSFSCVIEGLNNQVCEDIFTGSCSDVMFIQLMFLFSFQL